MTRGQRVVVPIAVGAALSIVAISLDRLLGPGAEGGWFVYPPDSDMVIASSGDTATIRSAIVWLAAIATWLMISWRLFAARSNDG